jgi:hypothetical protein
MHVPSSNGNHGFQGDRLKKVENTKSGPLSAEPHGSSLRPILLGRLHGDLCLKGTFQKPQSLRAFASVMPLHLQLFMKQAIERREHNSTSFASELFRSWDILQRLLKPSPAHDRGSFTSPGPLSTFPVTNRHYSYQLGFDHDRNHTSHPARCRNSIPAVWRFPQSCTFGSHRGLARKSLYNRWPCLPRLREPPSEDHSLG